MVNIHKGRAAIQRDLDRLEGYASRTPMKLKKYKCKVPCLTLAMTWTGEQFSRKGLGGLGRQQAGLEPQGQ